MDKRLTDTQIYNCIKANVALIETKNARSYKANLEYEHEYMPYALMAHFLFQVGYIYPEVIRELDISDYLMAKVMNWMSLQKAGSRFSTKLKMVCNCMDHRFGFHLGSKLLKDE